MPEPADLPDLVREASAAVYVHPVNVRHLEPDPAPTVSPDRPVPPNNPSSTGDRS